MLKLLRDLVLVIPIAEQKVSEGGIALIDADKTAPRRGVVVTTGPGKLDAQGVLKPVSCQKGDKIVYVYNNVKDLKVEGDTLHIVPEAEILCVLEAE